MLENTATDLSSGPDLLKIGAMSFLSALIPKTLVISNDHTVKSHSEGDYHQVFQT